MKDVKIFASAELGCPYKDWFLELPKPLQARVQVRIDRLAEGNPGNSRGLGNALWELTISPKGMKVSRVYFTIKRRKVIFLLCGGHKSKQNNDIQQARN